jgi:cleavage stimulation factor subunit 1
MIDKQDLVPLMISQLKSWGYHAVARSLQTSTESDNVDPSDKLSEICLPFVQEPKTHVPLPLNYSAWFTTQHRGPCRTAAFSMDGSLIATGSQDASLKVLDAERIKVQHNESNEEKKVIKTLYDHTEPVNEVCFHPNGSVLASCSDDFNIKLFDLQKINAKRGFRYLPVLSINSGCISYPLHRFSSRR